MFFNSKILNLFVILSCMLLSACSGKSIAGDDEKGKLGNTEIDEDGDWRLVSYRVGHETRVYGKNNDYVLSFDEDDNTFDFSWNNDTIDGEYSIVDETIRFSPDTTETDIHDEVLLIIRNDECYARQDDDSMIVILPDESQAVFTRIK